MIIGTRESRNGRRKVKTQQNTWVPPRSNGEICVRELFFLAKRCTARFKKLARTSLAQAEFVLLTTKLRKNKLRSLLNGATGKADYFEHR